MVDLKSKIRPIISNWFKINSADDPYKQGGQHTNGGGIVVLFVEQYIISIERSRHKTAKDIEALIDLLTEQICEALNKENLIL